jgi:hypothetical protein
LQTYRGQAVCRRLLPTLATIDEQGQSNHERCAGNGLA